MSKGKKVLFVVLLVIFIGFSVYLSFNMISRPTFEYDYTDNYNGTGVSGYVFNGFNGNSGTETVYIDYPYFKESGSWTQDKDKKVIAVDGYTFVSDEYVQYIYIGPDVEFIGDQAFVYCKKLRAVYVDDANPNYVDVNGVLYTKDKKELILYPLCHCTQVVYDDIEQFGEVRNIGTEVKETFTASGSADEIFDSLHSQIKNANADDFTREMYDEMLEKGVATPYTGTYYILKSEPDSAEITVDKVWTQSETYTVPEGVEKIAGKAFYKCDRLEEITLPSTVTEIWDMAFFKCFNTALIELPDGLEYIGDDAFSYCEKMRYAIFIPESVDHIGHHAFYKCSNDLLYYMGDKDESGVELGGRWQARSDNSFRADPPSWGKTRQECDEYNKQLALEAEKASKGESAAASASSANAGEVNTTIITLIIIFFFIPGFIYIGIQVIRALFKDDFLMTKKGKKKLEKRKREQELIHEAYVNAGANLFEEEKKDQSEEEEAKAEEVSEENSAESEEEAQIKDDCAEKEEGSDD